MKAVTTGLLALLVAGCAHLPAAQMALPDTLAGSTPERLQGLGGGRSGSFTLGGRSGRFERSASRLALFDGALALDRAASSYDSDGVQARCRARQTAAQVGVLGGAVRPYALHCSFSGQVEGELVLEGRAQGGERSGRASLGGVTLALQSVHRVQGSPLTLPAPIGYVLTLDGRPVGAVELNGTPRLWRPADGAAARAAVTHAALALALLWETDPA